MNYYITFHSNAYRQIYSSEIQYAEHTWICTEEDLQETLASIEKNKHKVIRIVKGVEIDFVQKVIIL